MLFRKSLFAKPASNVTGLPKNSQLNVPNKQYNALLRHSYIEISVVFSSPNS